ncbi:YxiJ family protein, partial [Gottfriedia acidiceleris]|uniref:YxiJ family protein n=1 Tax=Gottfriedia acidiceleris TaxID=371036 RepID=UPI002FFF5466
MEDILKQLNVIKYKLDNPFPYRDTDKIQDDFRKEFLNLSEDDDCLTGDFNTYCMNIAGTLSYVLSGNTNKIPKYQIEFLHKSFFEFF